MAETRPQSLGAALTSALGAITATKAVVKAAAAEAYTTPGTSAPAPAPAPGAPAQGAP